MLINPNTSKTPFITIILFVSFAKTEPLRKSLHVKNNNNNYVRVDSLCHNFMSQSCDVVLLKVIFKCSTVSVKM